MRCTPTCRAATRPCAIWLGSISASPCRCSAHASPWETIAAVAASGRGEGGGDLGMLRANWRRGEARWWESLAGEGAPKIIARLPFVERPDHPAGMPVFIISNPLAEAAARDVALFSAQWAGQGPNDAALKAMGCERLGREAAGGGASILASAPGDWDEARFGAAFAPAPRNVALDRQPCRTFRPRLTPVMRIPNEPFGIRIPLARKSARDIEDFRAMAFPRIVQQSCGNLISKAAEVFAAGGRDRRKPGHWSAPAAI